MNPIDLTEPLDTKESSQLLIGFARLNADGQNGTTGGTGGKTVTVKTLAKLVHYAALPEPYIIRILGTITIEPFGMEIRVTSNKTIIGVGDDAAIVQGGFSLTRVKNVIIRNLTIRDSFVEGDWEGKKNDFDGIQSDLSHHIWIDHCHFTRLGDGLIDLRSASSHITVSWCILSDHNKAFGIGWTDNTEFMMTLHHNWFRNTHQRNPSFDQGIGHLYNNFLENVSGYGNLSRGNARVVVENSYFRKVTNPYYFQEKAQLVARGNIVENNCTGNTTTYGEAFTPSDYYTYILDDAEKVPALLAKYAGPQAYIAGDSPTDKNAQ